MGPGSNDTVHRAMDKMYDDELLKRHLKMPKKEKLLFCIMILTLLVLNATTVCK